MDKLKNVTGWARQLTELGLSVLALAVVLQVLFGASVAFFPVDVVGNVLNITRTLGSHGLVGLVAIWVLVTIFNRKE
jgi:hypothetical protein